MPRFLWAMLIVVGFARAQVAVPAAFPVTSGDAAAPQQTAAITGGLPAAEAPGGKVGLVRGVLKRLDPIHDQLFIHTFGGGDVRILFDGRTQLLPKNTRIRLTSIPAGSVVSVDTLIDKGKLFARTVRTGPSNAVELKGQVVHYDAAKSQLTLRDPTSPENVSLRVTPETTVLNRGESASPQDLSPGMLVQVWISPTQRAANSVEILAKPGDSFTFEGRIVAVDLRLRVLALSRDTDQGDSELAIGSLDASTLRLLREGTDVSIQAEFDGNRYNARTVTLVSRNP